MSSLASRVQKLASCRVLSADECPSIAVTCIVTADAPVPDDPQVCGLCHHPHFLELTEVVVSNTNGKKA
jgi:hypothetical protein